MFHQLLLTVVLGINPQAPAQTASGFCPPHLQAPPIEVVSPSAPNFPDWYDIHLESAKKKDIVVIFVGEAQKRARIVSGATSCLAETFKGVYSKSANSQVVVCVPNGKGWFWAYYLPPDVTDREIWKQVYCPEEKTAPQESRNFPFQIQSMPIQQMDYIPPMYFGRSSEFNCST